MATELGPDDRRRADDILHDALNRPQAERAAYVAGACGADAALRDEVESLLRAHDGAGPYFDALADRIAYASDLELARREQRRIGPYRTIRLIGSGGMGSVFLAERADGQFEQQVAVKVMRAGLDGAEARRRFLAERQIVARLSHPNIARLLDGGLTDQGVPFFVMEFVDGLPITAYCDGAGLALADRLALVRTVGEAVQYAHEHLIIHRDLKPSNILVTRDGIVKLVDFGIAKLIDDSRDGAGVPAETGTAAPPLSLPYAAPEQVRGEAVTTATDVYGLGAVLYEVLAGRRPFDETDRRNLERAILDASPMPPSAAATRRLPIRTDLDVVCLKALQKEPIRRYRSAEQFVEDLRRYQGGFPVNARPDSAGYRLRTFVRRHTIGVAASAAIALLIAAVVVLTVVQSARTARERDKAEEVAALLTRIFEVADPSEARGATITAKEVLDRGVARVQSELASQPELQAALLAVIGRVYQNLGSYQAALPLLQSSLDLAQHINGADHADVVIALNALGELQRLTGDYAAAAATLAQALERSERVLGPRAPETARALNHSSKVQIATGQHEAAAASARRALAITRDTLGPSHPDIAESLMNLAAALFVQGRDADAEPLFRQALAMRREVSGPDHPSVPAALNNLAALLSRRGDHAQAEAVHREALAIYRRLLGDRHPRIATSLNNLGLALFAKGDLPAADRALRESLDQRRALLPPEHPDVAQSLANLGLVAQTQRRFDEATDLYAEALRIRRLAYPQGHPLVAQTINNIGLLRQATGDLPGAEALFREALDLLRATLTGPHPLVATALQNLGSAIAARGDARAAEAHLREALAIRRQALPAAHPETLLTLSSLGVLLAGRGDMREAAELLREAADGLAAAGRQLDPAARSTLARAYDALGDTANADRYRD
jgi:serine/threonine-protein kinase